jgi:hypothetical protein
MDNIEKIIEGLEIAYKRLVEFKKYKKTPLIVLREGKIVEVSPESIDITKNVYSKIGIEGSNKSNVTPLKT